MGASFNLLPLHNHFDPLGGAIGDTPAVKRHLSDMPGTFADAAAYEAALMQGNPLVYTVSTVELSTGEGDLHYGIGVIYPGKIGAEFFMTRGHLHSWRPAAELYVGLRGRGIMLLEHEYTGESRVLRLHVNDAVYVPGFTGHRMANVGDEPLVYLGIYPARAGHDYDAFARRNFKLVIVDRNGKPETMQRPV